MCEKANQNEMKKIENQSETMTRRQMQMQVTTHRNKHMHENNLTDNLKTMQPN